MTDYHVGMILLAAAAWATELRYLYIALTYENTTRGLEKAFIFTVFGTVFYMIFLVGISLSVLVVISIPLAILKLIAVMQDWRASKFKTIQSIISLVIITCIIVVFLTPLRDQISCFCPSSSSQ